MSYRRRHDRILSAVGWPDTNPRLLVRDIRWALRYWRAFHEEERLGPRWRFVLHQAWRVAPRNRSNDRVKYA